MHLGWLSGLLSLRDCQHERALVSATCPRLPLASTPGDGNKWRKFTILIYIYESMLSNMLCFSQYGDFLNTI